MPDWSDKGSLFGNQAQRIAFQFRMLCCDTHLFRLPKKKTSYETP